MKKIYKSYFGTDPGWNWPAEFAARFEANGFWETSAGYYFEAESNEHVEFLSLLGRLESDVFEEDLIRVSGEDMADYPYYRLLTKSDKAYDKPDYMDWESRCTGDDNVLCRSGGRQQWYDLAD